MKIATQRCALLSAVALLLAAGCCDDSAGDCEAGVTVRVLVDSKSDTTNLKALTVRWTKGDEKGKATYRSKEDRFFIAETKNVLGEKITVDVVFEETVISKEEYTLKWQETVCGSADGASWCDDPTYEWAEIDVDLRGDND